MSRLPARHQHHTSAARYENNVGDGAIHIVAQEPFAPAVEIFCVLLAMFFAASIAGFYLSKLF